MGPTAVVIGATGQTGAYLAQTLLDHGYTVVVTSRNADTADWWRFESLGITGEVVRDSLNASDSASLDATLETYQPSEIYYLAGPSSVAASFVNPAQSFADITGPLNHILETLRVAKYTGSFFNAASTDCFGNQSTTTLDEESPMYPVSPYAVAKAATFQMTKNYREAFGLNASNGILTNHDSPLRDGHFVTQKIVSTLKKIASGAEGKLELGNTAIRRDWLWAGDVAEAIHKIASAGKGDDYIVASGTSRSLDEFVALVCASLGLDISSTVTTDEALLRPLDIASLSFNPEKIKARLGWSPRLTLEDIVHNLVSENVNP